MRHSDLHPSTPKSPPKSETIVEDCELQAQSEHNLVSDVSSPMSGKVRGDVSSPPTHQIKKKSGRLLSRSKSASVYRTDSSQAKIPVYHSMVRLMIIIWY